MVETRRLRRPLATALARRRSEGSEKREPPTMATVERRRPLHVKAGPKRRLCEVTSRHRVSELCCCRSR